MKQIGFVSMLVTIITLAGSRAGSRTTLGAGLDRDEPPGRCLPHNPQRGCGERYFACGAHPHFRQSRGSHHDERQRCHAYGAGRFG